MIRWSSVSAECEALRDLAHTSVEVNQALFEINTQGRIWVADTTDMTLPSGQRDLVVERLLEPSWADVQYRQSPERLASLVVVPRASLEAKRGAWPGARPRAFREEH